MTDPSQSPDPAVTSLTAKAGDKVDNYTIMEQVGAGGTAIVFRGRDHVLKRDVAIKQLIVPEGESGEDIRQRALTEAQLHKRVAASDPKLLVQYIDTINDPRGLFLISEYVDGPSLEWILQQETGPMEQRQALGIIAATAKALDALHSAGIVHRDLKPSNVLMPREGGLKLADFGLASIIADQQTMDLGSVRYMAPELLQGQPATPKSDLYALGMMAYEMLAGRDKFNDAFRTILRDQRNQSMRWVKWHTNVRAKVSSLEQLVEGIPNSLSQLVARMMEKDPARRVGSCAELMEAIRSHFASAGGEQQVPSPHAAMAPPQIDDASATAQIPKTSKLILLGVAALVFFLIAIGGLLVWQSRDKERVLAERKAALVSSIEKADQLIGDREFEDARSEFLRIEKEYADLLTPEHPYREDLVAAGVLKAEALKAASEGDFITALEKSKRYKDEMYAHEKPPPVPKTQLSLIDANKKISQYDTRAKFQTKINEIQKQLDDGQLDEAIEAVRNARAIAGSKIASEDLRQLDQLENKYNLLLIDKGVLDLLAKARQLEDNGERRDAISLLEEEVDDADGVPDPRVISMLEVLNKRQRIAQINDEISEAEADDEQAQLLDALKELQRLQPTQALDVRINELEITMMLARAEKALLDGRPEAAQQVLAEVLERDPDNRQAGRMVGSIQDARKMVEAVREADEFMSRNEYAKAIEKYRLALTFGPDNSGRIGSKLKEATGEIHLANSKESLGKGDVVRAQSELDEATKQLGETDAILSLQARINDLRDYTALVKAGDDLFTKTDFGRAKAKYLDAKKIFDSEAINTKVSDCDFGIWLKQCDQAILGRDWGAAESALKRAEEIKKNAETAARREKIESRVK